MKKIFTVLLLVVLLGVVVSAQAETKLLPKGAVVSATITADGIAEVKIRGVKVESVEVYAYEGIKFVGATNSFKVNLREGRRFNFKIEGGFYALLTPEMKQHLPEFIGLGVDIDCSNPKGCCFTIK